MTKPTLNFNGLDLEKIEADPRDAAMYLPSQRKFTTQRELDNKARNAELKYDFWKWSPDSDAKIRFLDDMSGSMYPQTMLDVVRVGDKTGKSQYMIDMECTWAGDNSFFNGTSTNAAAKPSTVTSQTLEEIKTSISNLMKKFELNSEYGKIAAYDPMSLTKDFYFPNHAITPRKDAFFESEFVSTAAKLEAIGISKDFMTNEYMNMMAEQKPAPLMLNARHFDETIGGFDLGTMTALVGPTHSGLTRMSMAFTAQLAAQGHRILYMSLEMSVDEVEKRMNELCVRSGCSTDEAHNRVIINDEPNIDTFIEQVKMVRDEGIELKAIVVDRIETFYGDRSQNTRKLHRLALELNIPLIVTAQTNRQSVYDSKEAPSWPVANMELASMSHKIINLRNFKGVEIEMTISKDRNAGKTGLRCYYDIDDNEFIR